MILICYNTVLEANHNLRLSQHRAPNVLVFNFFKTDMTINESPNLILTKKNNFKAFWLGVFATSGSVARVAGPLVVTELYQELGTYAMLGLVAVTLVW